MGREDGIWAGVGVGWDVEQCEESRKKKSWSKQSKQEAQNRIEEINTNISPNCLETQN